MHKHPFLTIITIFWILSGLVVAQRSCHAEEPKKPAAVALPFKLSELDFARLKLAIAVRELAQQQAQRAVEQAQATISESDTEIDRICKDYKIDRKQLDHSVNAKTGEIIREPALMVPKASWSADPPPKKQTAKK